MNEIKIRDIPSDIIAGLNDLARKNHISRNEYLKRLLKDTVQSPELKDVDDKYEKLVDKVLKQLNEYQNIVEKNTLLFKEVLKKYE